MWTPFKVGLQSVTLDLNASGQGSQTVTQWLCDGVVVCNAVEFVNWGESAPQFDLCESCLVAGCDPGGRVVLRRVSDKVLMLPAFEEMLGEHGEPGRCSPPSWMLQRGMLLLSKEVWGVLQRSHAHTPSFESLAPVSTPELMRAFHFQAPRAFLPDYLRPSTARWELILCTNGQVSERDLTHLRTLLADPGSLKSGHEVCIPRSDSHTVSAFLDLPSNSEWPVFSSEDTPAIRLSDELYFRLSASDRL